MTSRFALTMVTLLALFAAAHAEAAEVAGVKLDDKIHVGDTELVLNGAGVRTKFMFKAYVAGLYLPHTSHEARTVLNESGPKRMVLGMLRDISKETLLDAMREGMRENTTTAEQTSLVAPMEKMESLFSALPSVHKGDILTLDFGADGVVVGLNGETRGKVDSEFFA